ncbi:MAG: class I SAM-dependent methyltransferase, partial [Nocardioidaceae bacterium]
PSVRAHLRLRWWTCPFPRIGGAVPREGRVLEVGCGHGLASLWLALESPRRSVVGIDTDGDKIAAAQAAAARARRLGASVEFRQTSLGALPRGPWDAVVVIDVLYLLDRAAQRPFVEHCAAALGDGGALVVKEVAMQPRWKYGLAVVQEIVSVRLARITEGAGISFVPPAMLAGWMGAAGLDVAESAIHRGYLHPHHLVVGHRR